jgi:putative acetyltransferase
MSTEYRKLQQKDNPIISRIIKNALEEHGVARPGTVYTDPTTDDLYTLFSREDAVYFIAEENGEMLGGCGVYPTIGLPDGCAELVKLYVSKEGRGKGVGFALLEKCAVAAKELGYSELYLETLPELARAVSLYRRSGYEELNGPLGDSGHFACSIWMLKPLK